MRDTAIPVDQVQSRARDIYGQMYRDNDSFYNRVGIAPPVPPERMAMGFMSLAEGVKLYMLSSPVEMTGPIAESLLTLFVDSIMRLARLEAGSGAREPRR